MLDSLNCSGPTRIEYHRSGAKKTFKPASVGPLEQDSTRGEATSASWQRDDPTKFYWQNNDAIHLHLKMTG